MSSKCRPGDIHDVENQIKRRKIKGDITGSVSILCFIRASQHDVVGEHPQKAAALFFNRRSQSIPSSNRLVGALGV
jgi:hypothetical protein